MKPASFPASLLPASFGVPAFLLAAVCAVVPGAAQPYRDAASAPAPTVAYADLADLVLAAPVVLDATIRSTTRIKAAEAAMVPAGKTRFYIQADVLALLRGPGAIPPRVGYLIDVAPDSAGRLPKLKKRRVLVLARPVAGAKAQLQLVTPRAQIDWSAATDATVRRIAQESVAAEAPPEVTGIGNAFHVGGTLPGEGETQIFLTTADTRPVSLSVLRHPGEQPHWAVALSEIVDDSAAPPPRGTLLWYRLACALPPALPDRAVASLEPGDADRARTDYRFVLTQLGDCGRTGTR